MVDRGRRESTRSACARWRPSPRPACARAGASWARPSRPPSGDRRRSVPRVAHRLLMEVHEAAGNPAEALRAFEELRSCSATSSDDARGRGDAVSSALLRGEPPCRRLHRRPPAPVALVGWPAPLRPRSTGTRSSAGRRELAYLEDYWRDGQPGAPARPAGRRRGHRQDAARAELRGARATRARSSSTAASTRKRSPPTSRWSRCCAAGRRRVARPAARAARRARLSLEPAAASSAGRPPADGRLPGGRRAAAPLLRRRRGAARRRSAEAPLVLVLRRPALGRPADAPAARPPRALAQPPARLFARHLPRGREPGRPAARAGRRPAPRGHARAARPHRPRRAEVGELVAALGVPAPTQAFVRALHGETEGQPVLHRGGGSPPARGAGASGRRSR